MSEQANKKIKMVYVGRRMATNNKPAQFWRAEGEEKLRGYSKPLCACMIGETWEFEVDEAGSVLLNKQPEMIAANHPETKKFEAEQVVADQAYRQLRAERAHKNRKTLFDQNMAPLKAMAATLNSYDLTHFVNAVTAELYRRGK